jgi:hypothetical protein
MKGNPLFDSIFGLPVHPLVVHAVVVLVPLASLAVGLAAVYPRFRAWAGFLPLALSAIATALVPVATSSGEALEERVFEDAALEKHTELGEMMLPWIIAVLVLAAAMYWIDKKQPGLPAFAPKVVAGLAVIAAVGSLVVVGLIGHSGAKSAWGDLPPASGNGD